MNKLWTVIVIASLALLLVTGPQNALTGMLTAGNDALSVSLTLLAVYAVWLGILSVAERAGVTDALARPLRPLVRFLFGKNLSPETEKYISVNMSANLIGMGGAATTMGIRAIESMDDKSGRATDAMLMLFVLNAGGIQLIPATLLGLRGAAGSPNPSDIILPVIIVTLISAVIGVALVKLCLKVRALSAKRPRREKKRRGEKANA